MERKITIRLTDKEYDELKEFAEKLHKGNISRSTRSIVRRYLSIYNNIGKDDWRFK